MFKLHVCEASVSLIFSASRSQVIDGVTNCTLLQPRKKALAHVYVLKIASGLYRCLLLVFGVVWLG